MNTSHAALSPSKRVRFSRCPGSVKYPEPSGPSNPSAIDGTHSHTLLERCVKAGASDPLLNVGITLEDHEGTFTVDSARAQRVKVAIDYVHARSDSLMGLCEIHAETRTDPSRLIGRDDMAGTFDIAIVGGGVYELIDYKDGMAPVIAENNLQLEQYAAGVLAEYPVRPYPFTEMWLTIIQPKLESKGMSPITTWKTTVDDIMDRVVPALQREGSACDDPVAPRIPGEDQCRYCPAKGFCPELAKVALSSSGISFPDVTSPLDLTQQAAQKDPSAMTSEQIVQILEAAPLVRQMIAGVEEEALKRLKAGGQIPGLKLVAGRGSRKWALPEADVAEKLKKMGMPKDAIWQVSLISPAQIEKVTWRNRKDDTMTLSPKKQAIIQQDYVARIAGKPTVALASDSREALITDASPLFGAVEAPTPVEAPGLPSWLT